MNTIITYAFLVLIAIAASLAPVMRAPPPVASIKSERQNEPAQYATPTSFQIRALPTTIANIRDPSNLWIRLDLYAKLNNEHVNQFNMLKEKISEDIIAHIKSMSLHDIDSPTGFLNLRADISHLVQVRSENIIQDIIITTMVIQ